jgi:three-Cys-motif partner protein
MKSDILGFEDDGLAMLDAGPWTEEKYRSLFDYIEIFATGMKEKWQKRVYIDLYSGPGCARIRSAKRILKGSPLLALSVSNPFDKFIFCELSDQSLSALQKRVEARYPNVDVSYVPGDCNRNVAEILSAIPMHSGQQKVLSFCFVDPFSLELQFETIKLLATKFMDFLVLLALDMDANRNVENYLRTSNKKIDMFLGVSDWRERWSTYKVNVSDSFQRFLAEDFEKQMLSLGYAKSTKGNTIQIRTQDQNLPLYHLAFFSRHQRGYDFWNKARRSSLNPSLFDVQ